MRRGLAAGLTAALVAWLAPGAARADLRDDARRVAERWAAAGQKIERAPAFFLEQGRGRRVAAPAGGGCLTALVLAPRATEFSLRAGGAGDDGPGAERSVAGAARLIRCGGDRERLAQIAVEMRSPRGAFEVIFAAGDEPAPDPREALPERENPPTRALLDPGRAPASEGLSARAARAEGRARGDGAVDVQGQAAQADDEGQGRLVQAFREGCHRVEILADQGQGGRVGDVDAELRDAQSNALIVRDRSDTPDARLEFCLGEAGAAALVFRGAPARVRVATVSSRWPLAPALPSYWGPRARSAMALTLARRRARAPRQAPTRALTGVGGATQITLEITPGACHLLVLGLARGEAKGLSISGVLEGQVLHDEGGAGRDGLALAFCGQRESRLPLWVEARGAGLIWGAALWRLEGAP